MHPPFFFPFYLTSFHPFFLPYPKSKLKKSVWSIEKVYIDGASGSTTLAGVLLARFEKATFLKTRYQCMILYQYEWAREFSEYKKCSALSFDTLISNSHDPSMYIFPWFCPSWLSCRVFCLTRSQCIFQGRFQNIYNPVLKGSFKSLVLLVIVRA